MNIFAYIRVSSKGQVEGDGPERQKDAINAFCMKHGLALPDANIYFEPGVSGTIDGLDRPAFTRMLLAAETVRKTGTEVAIVVERTDRLARDLMVSELLLGECRKRDLKVFSADHGDCVDIAADGDDPMRVAMRQIIGAFNQLEKSMLVKKLRLSRERMRQQTGRCEGRKPLGARPGEREALDSLRHFHELGLPPAQITKQINLIGFRMRNGSLWSTQAIRKQLYKLRKGKNYESSFRESPHQDEGGGISATALPR